MIIKKDPSIITGYCQDQSGLRGGSAELVVIPETFDEVGVFLRDCARTGMPVTVAGAGTGVTGGRVPFGGVLLSLERFTALGTVQPTGTDSALMTVGGGALVQDIKKAASAAGWMYPPDPTEQTSTIGGTIATNASGSRGFRFGPTRPYVQRITAAFTTGDVLTISRGEYRASGSALPLPFKHSPRCAILPGYRLPAIKNAAGYYNSSNMDLIDALIGQEGTLAVILEAGLKLRPAITGSFGGVSFFPTREQAWAFSDEARSRSLASRTHPGSRDISALALEYLDRDSLDFLRDAYPQIPGSAAAAILFEQDTEPASHDDLISLWAVLLESHGAPLEKAWFSDNTRGQEAFRDFRHALPEKINEFVARHGLPKVGTDIAVPVSRFPEMLKHYDELFNSSGIRTTVFGHIGECHLHANILPVNRAQYDSARALYIELARTAAALGGTVSAEHGIGKLKHLFLKQMVGDEGLAEMACYKRTFDPAGILGKGNIFP